MNNGLDKQETYNLIYSGRKEHKPIKVEATNRHKNALILELKHNRKLKSRLVLILLRHNSCIQNIDMLQTLDFVIQIIKSQTGIGKSSKYHQSVGRQYYNGHTNENISIPTKYYEQQGQSPPFSFLACSSPHEKDLHINKLHIRKKVKRHQIPDKYLLY